MSLRWIYEDQGLTREEAEKLVLSIGGVAISKGWILPSIKKSYRIHIVPSFDCFTIHEDTSHHTVHKGKNARDRCIAVLEKLKLI